MHSVDKRNVFDQLAETPFMIRQMVLDIVELKIEHSNMKMIGFLIVLFILYVLSPWFDIIPQKTFGLLGYVDDSIIFICLLVTIAGLYRRVMVDRMVGVHNHNEARVD